MENVAQVVTDLLAARRRYALNGIWITISKRKNGLASTRCTVKRISFHKRRNTERVTCTTPIIGRYVNLTMPRNLFKLVLCEVEVYGTTITGKCHRHVITLSEINIVL